MPAPDEQVDPLKQAAADQLGGFMGQFVPQQRRLYQYIFSLLPDAAEAEDVLQETTLVLWKEFATFEPGTNFHAWARSIAYHRILKTWRSRSRKPQYLDPDLLGVLAEEAEEEDDVAAAPREALNHCLQRLSPADQQLIRGRYLAGQSGKQLSDSLGRPVNSIYKSLGRIRDALLQCIERYLRTQDAPAHELPGGVS